MAPIGWLDAFDNWLEIHDPEAFAALLGPGLNPTRVAGLRAAFACGAEFGAKSSHSGSVEK